jgi:hypothetical protein
MITSCLVPMMMAIFFKRMVVVLKLMMEMVQG